jgi:hypothetical protein
MDIWLKIYNELEKALNEIGSVLVGDAKRMILDKNIKDRGDFYRNTTYVIKGNLSRGMSLRVGSNVKHEPYVLGGKEPSWTPFAPILGWVQRKGLSWTDKRGNIMKPEQMAWAIIHKIKREGIPARNIFADILKDRKSYVLQRLQRIGA